MTYKLAQIEGIGPEYASRLEAVGVHSSDDLLMRCASDEGRRKVAEQAGLTVRQLSMWMHQADLMRVSGIGSEFGQLLEASGVESVEQLATRDPGNVVNLLHRVNSEKKLTRTVPSIKTVSKWVTRARELVPARREVAPNGTLPPRAADVIGAPTRESTSGYAGVTPPGKPSW